MSKIQIKFFVTLIISYLIFNYFFQFWIGLCAPGGLYWEFADQNLNFIRSYRHLLLAGTGFIADVFGLHYLTNDISIRIIGHGGIKIVYSCLGYGIISVLISIAIAAPYQKLKNRIIFLICSVAIFTLLNMIRLFIVSYYAKQARALQVDHHDVFNILCYIIIIIGMYFWLKSSISRSSIS